MPFPWKKTKVSRFSRFVADLHSPKRGGSLVVETGFPTSLVDLFVKNRDRLKKQSKKKSKSQLHHSQTEISNPVISTPSPSPSQPPSGFHNPVVSTSGFEKSNRKEVQECIVLKKIDSVVVDTSSDERNIILAILKMFVVVILSLSTKRLAVGITMSAFLLLLLEFVGTRVLYFFKPCSKSITMIDSLFCKIKFFLPLGLKKESVVARRCEEDKTRKELVTVECDSSDNLRKSSVGEIQVEESNIDRIEEIRDMNSASGDERWSGLDGENKERIVGENVTIRDILACKREKSKGAKIRAKIAKKLVPKKLRESKKTKKNKKENESSSSESSSCRLQEQEDEISCEGDEALDDGIVTVDSSESGANSKPDFVDTERKGNSGYLILFLIVLVGLVGGKVLAFLLTVGWCLMLKLVGKLRRPLSISS